MHLCLDEEVFERNERYQQHRATWIFYSISNYAQSFFSESIPKITIQTRGKIYSKFVTCVPQLQSSLNRDFHFNVQLVIPQPNTPGADLRISNLFPTPLAPSDTKHASGGKDSLSVRLLKSSTFPALHFANSELDFSLLGPSYQPRKWDPKKSLKERSLSRQSGWIRQLRDLNQQKKCRLTSITVRPHRAPLLRGSR